MQDADYKQRDEFEVDVWPGETWELRMEPQAAGWPVRVHRFVVDFVDDKGTVHFEQPGRCGNGPTPMMHMVTSRNWRRVAER